MVVSVLCKQVKDSGVFKDQVAEAAKGEKVVLEDEKGVKRKDYGVHANW